MDVATGNGTGPGAIGISPGSLFNQNCLAGSIRNGSNTDRTVAKKDSAANARVRAIAES